MADLKPQELNPAPAPLRWWMLLLVGLLALGVYCNSLANDFALDDVAIAHGRHVVDLEWTAIWTDNYWPTVNGVQPDALYRPLTLWTYLANQAILPDAAWSFHLLNIVLHGLVSVLASVLAWRLLGNRTIALVAGILFAVHPIHVEAVANTVGRAELLAALWSLLALLVFLPARPLSEESVPTRRPWWHGLLVAVCFLAALLSKETPVTLLLAIPLLDAWRWTRFARLSRPRWWRWMASQAVRYYVPMAALFGIYLWARLGACGLMSDVGRIHHIVNPLVQATLLERLITPFSLLAKYLWLTFWPAHLSADYSAPSLLPTSNPFYTKGLQPPAAGGILLCVLAVVLAVRTWRKLPQITLLLGLFVTSYMLVANFLRIGTIFGERLFYWPSVFILMMVAWTLVAAHRSILQSWDAAAASMSVRRTRQRVVHAAATALLATVVFLMGWRSVVRNTDWAGNIPLAISTARDNPYSGKALCWAGANLIIADRPDYQEFGKGLLERSLELCPDYVTAHWEIAKYYGMRHDLGNSAIRIAQAAQLDSGSHMTRIAIPAMIEDMRAKPPASYMPVIQEYQRANPDDPCAYLALAFGFHAQGQYDRAEANARQALDMANVARKEGYTQFHEAGAELATIWFDRGKVKEATDKFRLYAYYMQHSVEAKCAFASMLMALDGKTYPGALDEADFNLKMATALDPSSATARGLRGKLNMLKKERRSDLATAEPSGPIIQHGSGVGP